MNINIQQFLNFRSERCDIFQDACCYDMALLIYIYQQCFAKNRFLAAGVVVLNPFRTAVPFWGQASQIPSSLSPIILETRL